MQRNSCIETQPIFSPKRRDISFLCNEVGSPKDPPVSPRVFIEPGNSVPKIFPES